MKILNNVRHTQLYVQTKQHHEYRNLVDENCVGGSPSTTEAFLHARVRLSVAPSGQHHQMLSGLLPRLLARQYTCCCFLSIPLRLLYSYVCGNLI